MWYVAFLSHLPWSIHQLSMTFAKDQWLNVHETWLSLFSHMTWAAIRQQEVDNPFYMCDYGQQRDCIDQ